MTFDGERMYELLPAIHRLRDAERGEPLKALLSVIADQVGVLEEDLAQLYDDQFIETCAEWVVPYIGDLIGHRSLHSPRVRSTVDGPLRNVLPKIGSQRAEVAHTIGFRRRKGTAAMLEQLARDVTGWSARAVEFFELLGWTQWTPNHIRPNSFYAPDLRHWEPLERIGTAFETTAHTVDVRHIERGEGRYNIPNVGIFLWRLDAFRIRNSPAVRVDAHRFLFSSLGANMPLFTRPQTEKSITHLAEPINVPEPISQRVLDAYLANYYGPDLSIFVEGIAIGDVAACNLSDADPGGTTWAHTPPNVLLAIDPVLGRISFRDAQAQPPRVVFHYGFSGTMGGGEYERSQTFNTAQGPIDVVASPGPIQPALDARAGGGVVEVSDSGRFNETPAITLDPNARLEFRAANEHRPTLVAAGYIDITGGAGAEVTLNGLLIAGGPIRILSVLGDALRKVRFVHCTLVPGLSLGIHGNPSTPGASSLLVEHTYSPVQVEIDHCILGAIRAPPSATVLIRHSVVDANGDTGVAYSDLDDVGAGGTLSVVNSTVIGAVHTLELQLASNSIFLSDVRSEKKQSGCVRFCYLPLTSVVSRRYRCQPERESDALRVKPQFTSLRYGDPGYGQLSLRTAAEIRTGADDEAELGAFHELYEPQRETNLRVRLEEYLRFGLEAGILYVT